MRSRTIQTETKERSGPENRDDTYHSRRRAPPMPRIPIDDLDDPRLAIYRHLKATNETRGGDTFIVEGEKLVYRLLASRFPTESVLVTDRYESHHAAQVPEDVPMFVIRHDRIEALVGYHFHRGVLACG